MPVALSASSIEARYAAQAGENADAAVAETLQAGDATDLRKDL